jgi:hypothetical protein
VWRSASSEEIKSHLKGDSSHDDRTAFQHTEEAARPALARHPLVAYFVIAFAFSWLASTPLLLSQDGAGLLSYRYPIGFYTFWAPLADPVERSLAMLSLTDNRFAR